MDNSLEQVANRVYSPMRAQLVVDTDNLLQSYHYTDHIERIQEVLASDIDSDVTALTDSITSIMEASVYEVLTNMFLVPSSNNLSDNFTLLKNMYLIENSFEHESIIEILEDSVDDDPKQTLVYLMERLLDADWADTNNSISDVMSSLIEFIEKKHKSKVDLTIDPSDENILNQRRAETLYFFTQFPDTIVQNYVTSGHLSVPTNIDTVLKLLTSTLFALDDTTKIAIELLAVSFILPITLKSVPIQAKKLVDTIYADISQQFKIKTAIDNLVANKELTREKQ